MTKEKVMIGSWRVGFGNSYVNAIISCSPFGTSASAADLKELGRAADLTLQKAVAPFQMLLDLEGGVEHESTGASVKPVSQR